MPRRGSAAAAPGGPNPDEGEARNAWRMPAHALAEAERADGLSEVRVARASGMRV
jgi:hypothetical protein